MLPCYSNGMQLGGSCGGRGVTNANERGWTEFLCSRNRPYSFTRIAIDVLAFIIAIYRSRVKDIQSCYARCACSHRSPSVHTILSCPSPGAMSNWEWNVGTQSTHDGSFARKGTLDCDILDPGSRDRHSGKREMTECETRQAQRIEASVLSTPHCVIALFVASLVPACINCQFPLAGYS